MLQPILNSLRPKMDEVISKLNEDLRTIRTGKANPSLIENVPVSYYGTQTPLKQMANISAPDATLLVVQPWDANSLGDIEAAIRNSNLGLNATNDGRVVRIALPPLTEERRMEFIKIIHQKAEGARITLRNLRKDSWEEVQRLQKEGQLTEDDRYRGEADLNKLIEDYNKKIDNLVESKEKELKTI
jgi:ribosome recycling factor